MGKRGWLGGLGLSLSVGVMAQPLETGLLHVKSAYTVPETVLRLESVFVEQGFTSESRLNPAQWGQALNLTIRPTWLLLLNHPQSAALMPCGRTVAIDLPHKALIWEDEAGQTWISYNDPRYLQQRHGLDNCVQNLNELAQQFEAGALKAAGETVVIPLDHETASPPNTERVPPPRRRN